MEKLNGMFPESLQILQLLIKWRSWNNLIIKTPEKNR